MSVPFRNPNTKKKSRTRPLLKDNLVAGLGRAAPTRQVDSVIKRAGEDGFCDAASVDRVEVIFGSGGGGAKIYTAYVNGWQCCLKELELPLAMPNSIVEMKREIVAMSTCKNPHLCTFLGAQRTEKTLQLFMTLYDGDLQSLLESLVARERHLPEIVVLKYCAQLLKGLQELHSNLIIHSDLKAANIFCSRIRSRSNDGFSVFDSPVYAVYDVSEVSDRSIELPYSLVIGDFGEAKQLESAGDWRASVRGTPLYNPPEMLGEAKGGQLVDNGYSFQADMWSLGQVLTELMTLRPPYHDMEMFDAIKAAAQGIRPTLPECCYEWYPNVIPIWKKLLTTEHNRASIFELLDELKLLINPVFKLPTLKQLLHDKNSREFLEFAESEFAGENVMFYQAVEEFKGMSDPNDRYVRFNHIYEMFIHPGAKYGIDLIPQETAIIERYVEDTDRAQAMRQNDLRSKDPTLGFSSNPVVGFSISVEPTIIHPRENADTVVSGVPLDVFDSAQEIVFNILKIGSFKRYIEHLRKVHGLVEEAKPAVGSKVSRSMSGSAAPSSVTKNRTGSSVGQTRIQRSKSGDSSSGQVKKGSSEWTRQKRAASGDNNFRKKSLAKFRNRIKRSGSNERRSVSPPPTAAAPRSTSMLDFSSFDSANPPDIRELLSDDGHLNLLLRFAKTLYAEEAVECWRVLRDFKLRGTPSLIDELFNMYLIPGTDKCVNIGGELQKQLLSLYEMRKDTTTLASDESLANLLSKVDRELIMVMKMDLYPKFIKRAKKQQLSPSAVMNPKSAPISMITSNESALTPTMGRHSSSNFRIGTHRTASMDKTAKNHPITSSSLPNVSPK